MFRFIRENIATWFGLIIVGNAILIMITGLNSMDNKTLLKQPFKIINGRILLGKQIGFLVR